MGGDRQTPGGSEAPGGARAPRRPRHAPQVVWRRREERGGRGPAEPGLLRVTPPGPVSSSPVPSSLPTRGMTPKPEPPCARSRICSLPPTGRPAWVPSSTRGFMDRQEMSVKKGVQNDY
ncbi:unnamed protein product [Rangifer tarandus platyrhynchus]|uniref:Uncharacterized protein n=1 Tax=Rangifer tarandus platyrhynchus TaxID=3082113 RepID=A0AC59ZPL0_RANTA